MRSGLSYLNISSYLHKLYTFVDYAANPTIHTSASLPTMIPMRANCLFSVCVCFNHGRAWRTGGKHIDPMHFTSTASSYKTNEITQSRSESKSLAEKFCKVNSRACSFHLPPSIRSRCRRRRVSTAVQLLTQSVKVERHRLHCSESEK